MNKNLVPANLDEKNECVKLNWYKPRMNGYVEMLLKIKRNMLESIK